MNILMVTLDSLKSVLEPLRRIADAYDANELDDDARKSWGPNLENSNQRDPHDIELYAGRGGKRLLTLGDCFEARNVLRRISRETIR